MKMTLDEKCRALKDWANVVFRDHNGEYLPSDKLYDFNPFTNANDWLLVMKKVAEQGPNFIQKVIDAMGFPCFCDIFILIKLDSFLSATMNAAGIAAGLWEAKDE
jgi:hypothetical protein